MAKRTLPPGDDRAEALDLLNALDHYDWDGWAWDKGLCGPDLMTVQEKFKAIRGEMADLEGKYRKRLWMSCLHPPHMRYGDDGEMQCCGMDFKRGPLEQIERHVELAGIEWLKEQNRDGFRS